MLEYLLYAIIIAPAALAGYRRSVREGHDSTDACTKLDAKAQTGTNKHKKGIDYQALS